MASLSSVASRYDTLNTTNTIAAAAVWNIDDAVGVVVLFLLFM